MTTPASQIVIFGLTGDLARRYILPALYQLTADELLPGGLQIVGVTRRDVSAADVLHFMREDTKTYLPNVVAKLEGMVQMHQMDLASPEGYLGLKDLLDSTEATVGHCLNRLYYLSMPPQTFGPVIDHLGASGLSGSCVHGQSSRLLIEKPFGFDLATAEALVERVASQFSEEQIYRIDHYLAKETAQNILTFRFSNPLFESVWHGAAVERIMITASEQIDVEGRGIFYEQTGALRDLIQSHLLQLLALVAMEEPTEMEPEQIHLEKLKLLEAVRRIDPDEVENVAVRGQYQGYPEAVGNPDSKTETFAALKLHIDNDRWRGVPVILQSGKALDAKRTEITLIFKDRHTHHAIDNKLTIRLQPDEGISAGIMVKRPGHGHDTELVEMDFRYGRSFDDRQPAAYERVMVDAIRGDRTLFATSDQVLESWRIVEPVIKAWESSDESPATYDTGVSAESLARTLF